ncbi:MAG TPA: sensor domain-containing diguanylate cyclase [Longimicrobiaceae bacterium]|nr:sensor domain-containing diguanylate cyclase [Longimicrobiaceae bacterium]
MDRRSARVAVGLLAASSFLLATGLASPDGSGFLLVVAIVGGLAGLYLLRPLLLSGDRPPLEAPPPREPQAASADLKASPNALADALRLTREATGAAEAVLWLVDTTTSFAVREAESAEAGIEPGPPNVSLPGHPFAWAVLEQVHVRLERGRRVLPSGWAEEMLLVPLGDETGRLLALAYLDAVPEAAEPAALVGARHISDLLRLLESESHASGTEERLRALMDAATALPAELEIDRFAARMCEIVQRGTSAEGSLMLIWHADRGGGEVVHLSGDSLSGIVHRQWIADGDSKTALAAKHLTPLHWADLQAESDSAPLLARGERWRTAPRSASAVPLISGDKSLGVILTWHSEPRFFSDSEREFLELLTSLAALPLQNATQYEELDRRASTDALTRLPNRGAFEARFASLTHHFDRYSRPFAVLILDIDRFKGFNDTFGHAVGDRVLSHVGEILRSTVREADFPARYGGEEFVILLPETAEREAFGAAERIRKAIADHPLILNGNSLHITVSLGVAACPRPCAAPGGLIEAADAALYRSKDAGRNQVTLATESVGGA